MATLIGKKAVITGGAMGIGLATAKRLVREGVVVTIWDLNESIMKDAKKELEDIGGKVFTYQADVSNKDRIYELVEQAKKDMGQIDILINNAGYVRVGYFWERPVEEAVRQFDVNVNAILYATHAVLPDMVARNSGIIVNLSSSAAWANSPGEAAYNASKSAVHMFTDTLRLEMKVKGKNGIKIISVHPGIVKHGMFEGVKTGKIAELMFPPLKDHDDVAQGIVERGIKKGASVVCVPRAMYSVWVQRGLIPNPLWDQQMIFFGMADALKEYKGRKGFAHSDPDAEMKK